MTIHSTMMTFMKERLIFDDYDAILESTARDLPQREFDVGAATRVNKSNENSSKVSKPLSSNVPKPSSSNVSKPPSSSVSKPPNVSKSSNVSKPAKGRGSGWSSETKSDEIDGELDFEPYDTGFDVHDDSNDGGRENDQSKENDEEQEAIIVEESTSGSSKRKETHYSSLGQDDELDFEDDDESEDDSGNFKRRRKSEEPSKQASNLPQISSANNNSRSNDSVFKKPLDPPKVLRPFIPSNMMDDEDPSVERRRAQRAARFNGSASTSSVLPPSSAPKRIHFLVNEP